jgi:hypothetical protein
MRKADARLLEYRAVNQHTTFTAAAFLSFPAIGCEVPLSVQVLDRSDDTLLQ